MKKTLLLFALIVICIQSYNKNNHNYTEKIPNQSHSKIDKLKNNFLEPSTINEYNYESSTASPNLENPSSEIYNLPTEQLDYYQNVEESLPDKNIIGEENETFYNQDVSVRIGAVCRDGTTSSATGRGACSHHGGVEYWLYE